MCHTSLKLILAFSFIAFVIAQDTFLSPCPHLFVYETESLEPDRWYGVLTMISDYDTFGAYVGIHLDRPSLQLGNWYGKASTEDNKKYVITNLKDQLKAHVPKTIRFFVKYDTSEPPPKLVAYHLNARRVCPKGPIIETTTMPLKLKTSIPLNIKPKPSRIQEPLTHQAPTTPSDDEDLFFMGDLFEFFNPPPKEDDICGSVVLPAKPLINHGQSTNEGEFPWHVALYYVKGVELRYICGASLISKDFVITAAHCVTRPRSGTAVNPNNLNAHLGKHYLKRFSNDGVQIKQISEIIVHPQYNGLNYSNDIALLKFAHPTEYNDFIRPICLWEDTTDLNTIVHSNGIVVGWGFNENAMATEHLMKAQMPVVSQKSCLSSLPDFFSRFTSENTFCAGYRNGTSVCNGDSGGGMTFPKSNPRLKKPIWQLRGLVSISLASRTKVKCDPLNYVIFTDTVKYLDWIKNTIK